MFVLMFLPLQARAEKVDTIIVNVHSLDEWKTYAKKYGASRYIAAGCYIKLKLWDDITIDYTKDKYVSYGMANSHFYSYWGIFYGEIDGQGHTINVNFVGKSIEYGVIEKFSGTVKNLNIKANIEYRYGRFSSTENAAFICFGTGNLTFINCHSRVNYREVSSHGVFAKSNVVSVGGFVNNLFEECVTTFKDCSFVGSFSEKEQKNEYWYDSGGFVGYANEKSAIYLQNCLSSITFSTEVGAKNTGYFVGEISDNVTINSSNSYYYSPSAPAGMNTSGATGLTTDRLKSGEVAYKLAAGRTGDNNPWRQTLGTDAQPETTVSSPKSKEVLHQSEVSRPATTNKWTTLFCPQNLSLPDGTTKYVVTGLKDGTASLSELNLSNTANVPMVLYNENGFSQMSIPEVYYNKAEQSNILRGVYNSYTAAATDYLLSGSKFVSGKSQTISPWTCYIAGGSGSGYEIEKNAEGIYVISSKEAWNFLKENYNDTEVNAYLDCDLTLTADDVAMEKFKGTFDGQGHSIIYDFNDLSQTVDVSTSNENRYGFIKDASGTFKNVNFTGTVKTQRRFIGGPLAYMTYSGSLNVENCHSDVTFYTTYAEPRYTLASGFLGQTNTDVSFTDCSFNGTFTSDKIGYAGGFVGCVNYNKASFTNCYSNIHTATGSALSTYGTSGSGTTTAGYFVGLTGTSGTYSYTNCYVHNSSKLDFSSYSDGVTVATEEQLTDGTTTTLLNADRSGNDAPWAQILSDHKEPQLKTFIGNGYGMSYAEGTIAKDENSHWTTLYYPADVTFTADQGITVYDQFATDDDGNLLVYENLSGTVKAGTPALLYAENGFTEDIALPGVYYNEDDFDGQGGYFTGVLKETDATKLCTLSESADGTASFAANNNKKLPAWQCYAGLPYAKVIPDGSIIYSKDNWNTFKTKYNGKKQGFARLATDLELTDDDEPMENFVGTFDGQGHTITVAYSKGTDLAPFKYAKGSTIRNLHIAGTISTTSSGRLNSPLIWSVEGTQGAPDTLTIDNCHSSVRFVGENGSSLIWGGGFVRYVQTYATVNFTDCSFTGGFETTGEVQNCGGFIGLNYTAGDNNTANFTNCFSAPTDCTMGSTTTTTPVGYLCGGVMTKLTYNVKNCYGLKTAGFTNKGDKVILLDSATIAKGSATYALNGGRNVWGQTVGTDALPQLKTFSPDSREVNIAADTVKIGTAGWSTHYYPLAETLPEGVKAYTVSGVNLEDGEYVVQLTEVKETIPAYTPVLLCTLGEGATEAEKAITIEMPDLYYNTLEEAEIEDNGQAFQLVGVSRATEAFDGSYVMQQHTNAQTGEKKTAFYRVNTASYTPTVHAWKCLLVYKSTSESEGEGSNVRAVQLRLDGETTGIDAAGAINSILSDGKTYDIRGRKVQQLQKGNVYIKNGQKFIIK